ncbi:MULTISPECIES: microcin C ABC transporter permease YejB [unclassified Rhizobium]|uniref:microcin C ABC transporter permease YejB n=1 Tax=unclassified Rhizobium TaxID=2613769 RepID=UPI0006FE1AD5|nr:MULTISPECIES: microcin C ABC transporter permease YejB [unclassified Rhizobium]KQV44443.1 microcin ABC transporter permease [Rhizobium sp. Root1212]KRD38624.1 microcin ABC transporter permease [Rhizobium sp. Root268]
MGAYILRRLLLMIPTIIGIMAISFAVVQFAPGGPVEQVISDLTGQNQGGDRLSGNSGDLGGQSFNEESSGKYRGAQGLDPEFIAKLEKQFGFDKPPLERFGQMMWNYIRFDFGESFFRNTSVIDLILDKMPVSISLGLWILILSYAISIPLGIRKAISDGSRFDVWTSGIIVVGYAVPSFLFGILLIVLFAGGSFLDWFPLRGIVSDNFYQLPWYEKIVDYAWHMTLPLLTLLISAFATTTLLTKNSFIDEIRKQYVTTARAKGLTDSQVLYRHVFRNAMLIIIAGFPGAFISAFFSGSLLIEYIFSLDGLGRLGYDAIMKRDYPIVFATLYIFSLMGLFMSLLSDLIYTWVDPRIDFERRDV